MRTRNLRSRKRAFTLIEMVVATFVLVIGMIAIMAAYSSVTRTSGRAQVLQTMATLAQRKISELEQDTTAISGGDTQGQFDEEEYATYAWRQNIETTEFQGLFKITLIITWGTNTSEEAREFVTYIRTDQDRTDAQIREEQAAQNPSATGASGTGGTGAGGGGGVR